MGAGVAKALGPHRAALLKNHGVVIVGATIEETVVSALMLETAAKIQMVAEAAGEVASEFAAADIENLQEPVVEAGSVQDQLRLSGAARDAPGSLIGIPDLAQVPASQIRHIKSRLGRSFG